MRVFVYEFLSGGGARDSDAGDMRTAGRAMRNAIVADLLALENVNITCATSGDDRPVGGARLFWCEPSDDESAIDFVRREAARHDLAWIVAPETDGVLGALCSAVNPRRWLGCDRAAIDVASSKRATSMRLTAAGIAATPLPQPLSREGRGASTAWVVKPDDGAGAVATRLHRSFSAAREDLEQRGAPAVLEPWIDGEALSLSLLCAHNHAELVSINRQRIGVDEQGRVSFDGVSINQIAVASARGRRLSQLPCDIAAAIPGLRGYVGIDVVWSAGGPVVIEVNPRVTCAYVGLSTALGRNLAGEILGAGT